VKTEGYKFVKPIRINRKDKLLNGSHRLAVALYFNVKKVQVWYDYDSEKKVHFNIKWFRKNRIKGKICKQIEKKSIEISERYGSKWI
jgi:hypothetical protein